MNYSLENLSVRIYWFGRSLVARDAFDQIAAYLRQLQALSPVFARFYVADHGPERRF